MIFITGIYRKQNIFFEIFDIFSDPEGNDKYRDFSKNSKIRHISHLSKKNVSNRCIPVIKIIFCNLKSLKKL